MYVLLFYFLRDGNLHFFKFCTFYNFTLSQLINFLVSFPGYTRLNGEHYSGTDRRTLIKRRERDHLYQSGRNSEQSLLCERWSWRRRHLSPQSFIQRSEAAAVGCPPHPYPQLWQEESNRYVLHLHQGEPLLLLVLCVWSGPGWPKARPCLWDHVCDTVSGSIAYCRS